MLINGQVYSPRCAYSCQAATPKTLDCPDDAHEHGDMDMEEMVMSPSPECLATNPFYLRSLAWCIHTHCSTDASMVPELEEWWVLNVAGRYTHQPVPNITYQEAVGEVEKPPTDVLSEDEVMNRTVLVDEDTYIANDNTYDVFEAIETGNSTAGLVIFITGAVIPIALSLLRLIPWPATLVSRFNAFFIDPPAFGTRHATPIKNLATIPTRGQALFIAYFIAANIIANAVGIHIAKPDAWYPTSWYQVAVYVSNRTGATSFANIPLLILFSSRNNVLLWLTDWSHSTFLLLHRYVAWLCTLEACIHSAIYLHLYLWKKAHAEEAALAYWYWGIIATLALSLLLPLSVRPIRSAAYELFRVGHIILAILVIVGSWYHIIERYSHQWGYETWMYMAMAIWAFDRIVRVARILRRGVHRAHVSRIDNHYIRVDVPGIEAEGHVYAYFPTLGWRVWENHPFSVVNSIGSLAPAAGGPETNVDLEKSPATAISTGICSSSPESGSLTSRRHGVRKHGSPGITLFVRAHEGATSRLASKIGVPTGIPVLIEASYGHESAGLLTASSTAPSPEFPNTICVAGGVGITGVLPALTHTLSLHAPLGSTKLFWGARSLALVEAVENLVADVTTDDQGVKWWAGGIEAHLAVGERMDLRGILDRELASGMGATVVVCGPEGMADDVRNIVSGLGRGGAVVRFVESSFTW